MPPAKPPTSWLGEILKNVRELPDLPSNYLNSLKDSLKKKVKEEATDVASDAAKALSGSAALGALSGAVTAPKGESGEGAVRGAVGGILGAAAGFGWGKDVLPAVGGAIVGGAIAGKTVKKERPMVLPMMNGGFKYAGVTLDWYDDQGETLKQKFPTPEDLPDVIKTASIQEKERLPNEAFALIMVDQGHAFRKYACADPGTTAMSVVYFMEHGDKLPEDAQKTAASNLVEACLSHGILPPVALTKLADMIPGGKADKMGDSDFPKKQMEMGQKVEMEHTDDPAKAREISRDHLEEFDDYYTRLHKMESEAKKEAQVIDITGRRPKPIVKQAAPQSDDDYCVVRNGERLYPIHNWDMVKKAESYFLDQAIRMDPELRREYAVKLARKSFIIGYPLDPDIVNHGALSYNGDEHIKAAMDMRKHALPDQNARDFLDDLMEKRAEIHPEVFAECVRRIDVQHGLDKGWDHLLLDPWSTTFGIDKTAEVVWEQGADRVTSEELINLARNNADHINGMYNEYFTLELQKDPIGVFKSLPDPQKKQLARMAADLASKGGIEFMATKNDPGTGLDGPGKPFKTSFGS